MDGSCCFTCESQPDPVDLYIFICFVYLENMRRAMILCTSARFSRETEFFDWHFSLSLFPVPFFSLSLKYGYNKYKKSD